MGARKQVVLRAAVVIGLAAAGLSVTTTSASADEGELSVVSGSGGTTGAAEAYFAGATPDGSHVYFQTGNSLDPVADTDGGDQDVYERAGGVTTLVSTGPTDAQDTGRPGSDFGGVSADGSRVFFQSYLNLTADDTDNAQDVYERSGGVTTLISQGPHVDGSSPNLHAFFEAASADGSRVAFLSQDQLVAADTDTMPDLYLRAGTTTTLISGDVVSANGNYPESVRMSADGSRVSFRIVDQLTPEDTDNAADVYLWDATGLHLLSEASGGGLDDVSANPEQMSGSGAVLFSTEESLLPADTDTTRDYYLAAPGQPLALVTGSGSESIGVPSAAMSDDGQHVVYVTRDNVSQQVGVHRNDDGQHTAVPLSGTAVEGYPEVFHVSPDGTRALIEGDTRLTSDDTDDDSDDYLLIGSTLSLVTPTGGGDAYAYAWPTDLRRVVYDSKTRVLPSDTDDHYDSYAVAGGQTTLITSGTTAEDAYVVGMSADGRVMWFEAEDALLAADTNTAWDVYQVTMLTPSSTGGPSVGGTPAPGQTLTCLPGSWRGGPSFAYQWNRDGAPVVGATGATYAVQAGDAGHALSCTVTATNTDGSAPATSAAVTVPAAGTTPPPPGLKPGPCANVQKGTTKPDRLTGTTAGDKLVGRGGNDVLRGLGQDDCLAGGGGKDKLKGGPGEDKLVGGPKKDTLVAGGGKDVVRSRDGVADVVRCGGGRDKVVGDKADELVGCEVQKLK